MRKIIPVVAAGATTLALAGTTFGYANLNKYVTLSVDGQTRGPHQRRHRGRPAEEQRESKSTPMTWSPRALDAKVEDGTRVAVKFGRQVTFTIDGAAADHLDHRDHGR